MEATEKTYDHDFLSRQPARIPDASCAPICWSDSLCRIGPIARRPGARPRHLLGAPGSHQSAERNGRPRAARYRHCTQPDRGNGPRRRRSDLRVHQVILMTITVDHRSSGTRWLAPGSLGRLLGIGYGTAVTVIFVATLLYAIGFVSGVIVPKSIDSGTVWPPSVALCIDLQLLGLFMAQHSGMARRGFKRVLPGHVPPLVERATYVLCASLVLILLFAAWQPLPATVWQGAGPRGRPGLGSVSPPGGVVGGWPLLSRPFKILG